MTIASAETPGRNCAAVLRLSAGQATIAAMRCASAFSPAKLNFTLRVGLLRPDGFHSIESLACPLTFGDEVHAVERGDREIVLECDAPDLPVDDRNLARLAARLLAESRGASCGVTLRLAKRVPAGAGLGGGSSNAATTLRLLNDGSWGGVLSGPELARLAARIGSDVPFFLQPGAGVMRGRGEEITRLALPAALAGAVVVLLLPAVQCETAAVYRAFDRLPAPPPRGALDELLCARTPEELMERLYNDLEPAAYAVRPELAALRETAERVAGGPLRMTGSGAAHFRLFSEQHAAERYAGEVRAAAGVRVELCGLAV
jgi:4-diphosphocytidyl-2-C-methyl-D-erythritol kinase